MFRSRTARNCKDCEGTNRVPEQVQSSGKFFLLSSGFNIIDVYNSGFSSGSPERNVFLSTKIL